MRIAIITLHGYFNYGNRLQNYALQTALEKLNTEVSTWVVSKDTNPLKRYTKKYIERVDGKRKIKSRYDRIRERNFKAFSDRHIPTRFFYYQNTKFPAEADGNVDAFIVGSDQVWNPLFWRNHGDSSDLYNYCLAFTKKKKISYAASFGIANLPEQWKSRMMPLLSDFDAISVRETEGKEILRDIGCEAEVVLDPTMLLTAEEWRKVESCEIKDQEDYVLTFFLGEQPAEVQKKIRDEEQRSNRRVVNLMDENCLFYTKGPETFLELIDKAALVYTDSFHATVFSILFHTPFVVFERKHANRSSMSSRITTLLSCVGVVNGISDNEIKVVNDFEGMDEKLTAAKEKSIRFLTEALSV